MTAVLALLLAAAHAADSPRWGFDVAPATRPWTNDHPQAQPAPGVLRPVLELEPGTPNPEDLHRFGGLGTSPFASPRLPGTLDQRLAAWAAQRLEVDAAQRRLLSARYDLSARADGARMSGGKPVPLGPVARLPQGVDSREALAALGAAEIRRRGLFPYKPLPHPLQSSGGTVFPPRMQPELQRVDVGFDLPEAFLPEYPAPLFLVSRPDLGDVSRGRLVDGSNYFELFNGVLTPEQLEGARLAAKPLPTLWFNDTHHRATRSNVGASCLHCHANGHASGAFDLEGTTAPRLLRPRMDVPSLRGVHSQALFGLKRGRRPLAGHVGHDHHFGGDTALEAALSGSVLDGTALARLEAFFNAVDFPPAPKLDVFGRLDPAKATEAERRGEGLFFGKAKCAACHQPPAYTDGLMHDLRVERFYDGRAEGWAKTYPLRGIKDSPPYLHDGRLPTLEDAVEFFDLVLGTGLDKDEKRDLAAFLRAL